MQNTERQKFEENWKSAFDGAEMTPSDNVWNSIELNLAGQESATMKKRVVFYQRLAAATVIFALLTGTYAFYTNYNSTKEIKQTVVNKKTEEPTIRKEADPSPQVAIVEKEKEKKKEVKAVEATPHTPTPTPIPTPAHVLTVTTEEEAPTETLAFEEPKKETQQETQKETVVTSPLLQTAPLTASLEEQKKPEEVIGKKNRGERTWLALGGSAGSYSQNTGGGGSTLFANKSQADMQTTYSGVAGPSSLDAEAAANAANKAKVGSSYTLGMAVGKKFGRLVVQSGVNFGKQQIDYTSTYDTRLSNNTAKASASMYSLSGNTFSTTPYTVNSSMDIISIPVQAGYMIVDRRLGWQMNAGVSPDFFLRNTLVDKSGQRQRFTQSAGEGSPYRSVNWSGLMNTELSYRIGDHYRVSLVPGMRYSFTSILKDDKGSKPLILDVGFRFRYMFD